MKIEFKTVKPAEGSALVIAIVICSLIGIGIGSYFLMIGAQARSVTRSQAWNTALMMAEAGAEEGLAQLNPGVATTTSVDRTANGWGAASGGFYGPKTRSLSNDSYAICYTTELHPTIYSTGKVVLPTYSSFITRVIQVSTTNVPLFTTALAARMNIDMNGNRIVSDSFDSADPNFSTNGAYSPFLASTNGDVASLSGLVDVGNAEIHGDLYLGPSASGSVNNGTVSGTTYTDFNVDFPEVILPKPAGDFTATSPLLSPVLINGTLYNYNFAGSGDYRIATPGNIYVAPGARVRLLVTTSMSPNTIRVGGAGTNSGNLQLYMAGASFSLTGSAIVDGGNATNLAFWGLPSNTSVTMNGNAAFVGTVYAPQASFTLNGGGSGGVDFAGSIIAASATLNGHFNFHFDENLLRAGASRGYSAKRWKEL